MADQCPAWQDAKATILDICLLPMASMDCYSGEQLLP
jgi:hypothetical protein